MLTLSYKIVLTLNNKFNERKTKFRTKKVHQKALGIRKKVSINSCRIRCISLDSSQMETAYKKGDSLAPKQGRPVKGALSTYPKKMVDLIYKLRYSHEGWGPSTIFIELEDEHGYLPSELPCLDTVNRYFKEQGFIKAKEPRSPIPSSKYRSPKKYHELWEMDAQGAVEVEGFGYVAMINIKDSVSKVHAVAFPVHTGGNKSQPKTSSYYWALRLAFEDWGMPQGIQVDKDSVFIDNTSKSPFPSRLHLFLIGLGIDFHFIDAPPPQKQSIVERSHQTAERQILSAQRYESWQALFKFTKKGILCMNTRLPNRSLGKQPPLKAHPKAKHSGRSYQVKNEAQIIDMQRIYNFLEQGTWYRKVSNSKTLSFNSKQYFLNQAKPGTQLQIKFCSKSKKLIFRDAKELIIAEKPIRNFSIETVMGGTQKEIIAMKKKLAKDRNFPL